jgi:hypothetical protein
MFALSSCPDVAQLRQLVLGQLSESERDRLQRHVAQCPRCRETLHGLEQPAKAPRTQDGGSDPDATTGASDESQAAPAEGPATILTFLDPPRQEGEVGRLGGYRLLRVLGQGGMGVVFAAEDLKLNRPIAIKIMRPELAVGATARERFLREARAAAALQHDHIVTVYHVDEANGMLFLTMPLLQGESLTDRLKRERALPVVEVLRIGREVAAGLAAAHDIGLIHRDIKPANLWLEKTGRVKILDFGLARAARDNAQLTQEGAVVGTPAYMAPEQAQGNPVDARADLFSLGSVLYRLATGQQPFRGKDTVSTLLSLVRDQPAPPRALNPTLPRGLSDMIMRLLAKEPSQRPASARAVADALAALAVNDAPAPRPAAPRRRWLLLTIAAAFFIALASAIVILIRDKQGKAIALFTAPDDSYADVRRDGAAQATKNKPFILTRAGSAFAHLEDALEALGDGDTIVVHGDGPFPVPAVRLQRTTLTLRAAPGFRPVFVGSLDAPVPKGKPWFDLDHTAVDVEGCDFRCPADRHAFVGGNAPWTFRSCRLFGPPNQDQPRTPGVNLLHYGGPRLRVADSLVSVWCGCALHVGPRARVELNNNILQASNPCVILELEAPGGQDVSLTHNTTTGHLLDLPFPVDKAMEPAQITAEANLFATGGRPLVQPATAGAGRKPLRDCFRWRGKHNLYGPAAAVFLKDPSVVGYAAWRKFCGDQEEDSRSLDFVYRWHDDLYVHATAQRRLRQLTEELSQQHGRQLGAFGPDWQQVGPGENYLRARSAAGDAVPQPRLRSKPEPGGAFVLLRKSAVVRGYSSLREAADAAAGDDIIEVRGDGPFPAGPLGAPPAGTRRLTVRGAAGYAPVLTGPLTFARGNELIVENLHFSRGGLIGAAPDKDSEARLVRLANCLFEGWVPSQSCLDITCHPRDGEVVEIVNCMINTAGYWHHVRLAAGRKVVFRHCGVVGPVRLEVLPGELVGQVEVERCAFRWAVPWWPATGRTVITARGSLFEGSDTLVWAWEAGPLTGWRGSRNVYHIGHHPWMEPPGGPLLSLDDWRKRWGSSEEGSVATDPSLYDPLQWRIVASDPMPRTPDGKDIGADVQRVARRTNADKP